MKKLILLAGIIMLCFHSFSQTPEPPRGSNLIVVKGTTFAQVKSAVLAGGYLLDYQDQPSGAWFTKPFLLPESNSDSLMFRILMKDSVVKMFALWNSNKENGDYYRACYPKEKEGVDLISFNRMIALAKAMHGSEITYQTDK